MGMGIIICGLNGTGKSTLGKALADQLKFHLIDIEDLYFPKTDPLSPYATPRTGEEVGKLLFSEMTAHKNFVFTSVKGDYGESVNSFFQYAILIEVPKDLRMLRVKNRSFQKFGKRMLPGGDLHDQEERFFHLVESRAENLVKEWVKSLKCPIIRVDGTKSIEENTRLIIAKMHRLGPEAALRGLNPQRSTAARPPKRI